MPSPIAKYFSRAFKKIVKFQKIPDFSPAGPISGLRGMEEPTWRYFAEIRANPLFFSPRGVQKIMISKIDSTNLLIMVIDKLENKKCYA